MINKDKYIEINESKCSDVNNCFGVKEEDGKKYCRGCGSVQPDKVKQRRAKNNEHDKLLEQHL